MDNLCKGCGLELIPRDKGICPFCKRKLEEKAKKTGKRPPLIKEVQTDGRQVLWA